MFRCPVGGDMLCTIDTVAPSVTLHQQLIGAPLGSTVSLDCSIESSPMALHFWTRSDGSVLHEASKYLMQSSSFNGPVIVPSASSPPTWPSFRTQVRKRSIDRSLFSPRTRTQHLRKIFSLSLIYGRLCVLYVPTCTASTDHSQRHQPGLRSLPLRGQEPVRRSRRSHHFPP